ncbi:MAG: TPM domain-containing protein [Clostridia bacterium]|nr:TPM domain-containing protein [Clostridia bacterium]
MKNTAFYKNLHIAVTVLLLACFLFAAALPAFAAYPKKDDNIADEAGVLSEGTIRTIKTTNASLEKDLGVTIAVCTVKTTGETDIAEYAAGLFKSWKLGEGILLLIASEDENYYFLQSTGVDKIITNDVLAEVRNGYLETDFASGNIDRGVMKSVSRLSSLLVSGFKDLAAAEDESESTEGEEKGTTIGSVLIGFFKFLLFVVLFAILAFVILFIAALFNDDCAALLQKYVFRRGRANTMQQNYYDERLYGQPQRRPNPNSQQRRPNPNASYQQRPVNRQSYPQQGYSQGYGYNRNPYAQQGTRNAGYTQNPNAQNSYAQLPAGNANGSANGAYQNSYPQQNRTTAYYNADGTPRRAPARPAGQQPRPMNGDETRAFTIPNRDNR